MCDLMWSVADDVENWQVSSKGAGWVFGSSNTSDWNQQNGFTTLIRSQVLQDVRIDYIASLQLLVTILTSNFFSPTQ